MNRAPKPGRAILLVARRELIAALRNRSVVTGMALAIVVLAGFVVLQSTVLTEETRTTVGLNGQAIAIAKPLTEGARDLNQRVRTIEVTDLGTGEEMVAAGKLDALVSGAPAAMRVLVRTGLDDDLRRVLNGLVQQQVFRAKLAEIAQLAEDIDPQEVLASIDDAHISVRALSPTDPTKHERTALGLSIGAILFLAIMFYATLLTRAIVEEKSAGRVELMLATTRPESLVRGRVLGIGALGLGMLAVLAAAAIVSTAAAGVLTGVGTGVTTVLWGLLLFAFGFPLYATVFVAAGALVARRGDIPAVLTPVYATLAALFALGFIALARDPGSGLTTALSLVPPLSPVLMPGRLALDLAPWWQPLLAIALTAGATALLARPATHLFHTSALHNGARRPLREALRQPPHPAS